MIFFLLDTIPKQVGQPVFFAKGKHGLVALFDSLAICESGRLSIWEGTLTVEPSILKANKSTILRHTQVS